MDMSLDQVKEQLLKLYHQGEPLNKKKVKKSNPDLMKHALYYYPSWEHALQDNGLT